MATIYGVPPSPYVRKVMLAHALKGVVYELAITMPGSDDKEFREASPLGKVPGYRTDDGAAFADSSVIIAYLEKTSPEIKLYPQDANDYARALWLEEYGDTAMTEACAALYFQRVIGPKYFSLETDQARVSELVSELIPAVLNYVENQLGSGDWLVGDTISVADLAIGTNLVNLYHAKFEIDQTRWPKLARFKDRFMSLEAVKAQLTEENAMFAAS